jgi:hypothetical protein
MFDPAKKSVERFRGFKLFADQPLRAGQSAENSLTKNAPNLRNGGKQPLGGR